MNVADIVLGVLVSVFGLVFVSLFVTHMMTSLRLRRNHPEQWESLGRPYPFVPPRDKKIKAAQYDFFWKRGYEAVSDERLQTLARKVRALGIATLVLLALLVSLFLFNHYALK